LNGFLPGWVFHQAQFNEKSSASTHSAGHLVKHQARQEFRSAVVVGEDANNGNE